MLMNETKEKREVDEKRKVLSCGECLKSPQIGDMGFVECYRDQTIRHKNSRCQREEEEGGFEL